MSAAAILAAIASFASSAPQLVGLVTDIVKGSGDTEAVAARLRALLPGVTAAAQTGATPATEQHWAEERAKHPLPAQTAVPEPVSSSYAGLPSDGLPCPDIYEGLDK